jgi:hypothetical protein
MKRLSINFQTNKLLADKLSVGSLLPAVAEKKITQKNVKLCVLCGTLNLCENAECWTCRWHGDFSFEEQTISLAWLRLESLYEEVRIGHVTSRKMRALGDFGALRPRSHWQIMADKARSCWQNFQTQRDLRAAQRAERLRSRTLSRPDQLGV